MRSDPVRRPQAYSVHGALCRRFCAWPGRALSASVLTFGVHRYANAEMCKAAKHHISMLSAASKARQSVTTGVGPEAPAQELASDSAERHVAGTASLPVAPALAPASNSKKRKAPGSGQRSKRGANVRARSEASAPAAHTTRPQDGGESGWEASTSGGWSEGSLFEPTAPNPLAAGGMSSMLAMAKLAPQILQSAGV